jgi:hypothetical protein
MRTVQGSRYSFDRPARRPLKIYASDPMAGKTFGNQTRIEIDNELLRPGPQGKRIEVIDFDGATGHYYPPIDLDDRNVLMQGGIDPTESDPRFHQQMVYAVAMSTLQNFDRALGRTVFLSSRGHDRLRLFPHAFYGANAYYDRRLNAILFGYFKADPNDPGPNLPGQTVFTCLSHDIIAHEMTHAIVDRLRHYFLEPSNHDVLAFHEGFADLVALFQHFSFSDIVREQIQRTRSDIRDRGVLVELAPQFGYAQGSGQALRTALKSAPDEPEAKLYETVTEPHDRGLIFVTAVFDAFFGVYQRRIRDLIRIATGGTGTLPQGDLPPDLVNRIAKEASQTAQSMLAMCIRAFDYLPPVDVTFGEYLRALVTVDMELSPQDEYGQRSAIIEAFRLRGIYAENTTSLAEESLRCDAAPSTLPPLGVEKMNLLPDLLFAATSFSAEINPWATFESESRRQPRSRRFLDDDVEVDISQLMAQSLNLYARQNRAALFLKPDVPIQVHGFHPVFRVAPSGKLLIELVVQLVQTERATQDEFGGIPLRGGTTLIASADGRVRYVIAKPLPHNRLPEDKRAHAKSRRKRQLAYVEHCDLADPYTPYYRAEDYRQRMRLRMNLRALHASVRS